MTKLYPRNLSNLNNIKFLLFILLISLIPIKSAYTKPVKNVVIMIADGFGPAGATLARYTKGSNLFLDEILVGTIQTRSSNSLITDSAASATAYATGYKTKNGVISMEIFPNYTKKLTSIMELARKKNMATGIVVKDNTSGATPGAFSAHVISRDLKAQIAAQQINAGFDVLFGGGRKYFMPPYNINLLDKAKNNGIKIIDNKKDLVNISNTPVLGLFGSEKLNYAIDYEINNNQPNLKEMTLKALELLNKNSNGFVLMIEGSKIDNAAHINDTAAYAREILEYDNVVGEIIKFIDHNPETLMISLADHETGGATVGADVNGKEKYSYNTDIIKQINRSMSYLSELLDKNYSIDNIIQLSGLSNIDLISLTKIKNSNNPIEEMKKIINNKSRTGWTTKGHTAIDVNLYAYGAGSNTFIGNYDNTEINHKLVNLLNL